MTTPGYVHGYSDREEVRLVDQASTLVSLIHAGTRYPAGAEVLEAGCGVGAQTVLLALNSPEARFTSVDVSTESLLLAEDRIGRVGIGNVRFERADILRLPFPPASFDHVFACFVLEHLPDPLRALQGLRRQLRPGGTLTVVAGDHGSTFFHPGGAQARRAIECLVELQARAGGDPHVGRRLYPLLGAAGLEAVAVSPRTVYVDGSRPGWADGFTLGTYAAMVEGVGEQVLAGGLMAAAEWRRAIEELRRAAEPDGVFCYTFFKGVGVAPAPTAGARAGRE